MMMLSVDDGDRRGEENTTVQLFCCEEFAIRFDAKLTMSRKLRVIALISYSHHLIKVRFEN